MTKYNCVVCGGYLLAVPELMQRSCLWCGRAYPTRELRAEDVKALRDRNELEYMMSQPSGGGRLPHSGRRL